MHRRAMLQQSLAAAAWMGGLRKVRLKLPTIRFGYAAITWGGKDRQAIEDISALGYRGIQLRASALEEWGDRPRDLADLLATHRLTLVALSSGVVRLDPAVEAEDLETHIRHAKFLRDAGGLYLQVLDERPPGRAPIPDDYRRMGRLLTELGRRTGDLGIPLGYHNHMGSLGQGPDEIARVLDAADPRFVKLELDTAHYQQGGGLPATAVKNYGSRLLFLHLKDLESPLPTGAPESYRFVEMGQGRVDFPQIFAALDQVAFHGWAIVELDEVPIVNREPQESAAMSKRYLEGLGFTI